MKTKLLAGVALAASALLTREAPPPGVTFQRGTPPPTTGERFMAFTGSSYDPETRECDATFATGEVVKRWYGTERLSMEPDAIVLRRVALNQCRLLFGHDARVPIGVVFLAEVRNGQLEGRVRFFQTPDGDKYAGMVQRGELTGISVGYSVLQWTLVSDVDAEQDDWSATRWELMEVSLVPVPADPFAGVRSAATTPGSPPIADPGAGQSQEEEDMQIRQAPGSAPAGPAVVAAAGLTLAQALGLRSQAVSLGVSGSDADAILQRDGLTHAAALEAILNAAAQARAAPAQTAPTAPAAPAAPAPTPAVSGGLSVAESLALRTQGVGFGIDETAVDEILRRENITRAEASEAILAAAASVQRAATALVPAGSAGRVTVDATETQRTFMIDALHARMSHTAPSEGARQFMGWSVMHMWAERAGINERDPVKIYEAVASRQGGISMRSGAMMTAADFPLLLEAAANKTLQVAYATQTPTYRRWAKRRTFKDFKPHNFYRVGDFPKLLPLGEHGEIKAGSFTESKESAKLSTSGRLVMLTRHMLVNDDMNAFGDFSSGAGRSTARRENEVAYNFLRQNDGAGPIMADGKAMFHVAHKNIAAAGSIPSEESLDEAAQASFNQTDLDGNELNVEYPLLLIGPKLSLPVAKLLVQITPTRTEDTNIYAGRRDPVTDAKIKDGSWYNLGNAAQGESNFLFGYLGDREGPQLREDRPFNFDGVGFGLVHDFGFGADDHRFGYFNEGES